MANFSMEGRITYLSDPKVIETKSGKQITKRELVVKEMNEEYPQEAKFDFVKSGEYEELAGDKFPASKDQKVLVEFNLVTNQSKDGRYFTNLQAWKITPQEKKKPKDESLPPASEDDDLPF